MPAASDGRREVLSPPAAVEPSTQILGRVRRGLGALGFQAAASLLGQLAVVPVAMRVWGKTTYGEWVLLTGLVTFLKLADLGLQTVAVNRLTAAYARGDRTAFHNALHSAMRVQIPLAGAALTTVAAVAPFVPLASFLSLRTIEGLALAALVIWLALELLLGVPMGTVAGVYRATGHLSRGALVGTGQQLMLAAATIGLMATGAGFATIAFSRCAIALLACSFILVDLKRLHPWLALYPRSGTFAEGLRLVAPGLYFLFIPIADYLGTQLTLAVVQHHLGGANVALLATHRTLSGSVMLPTGLLLTAAWPELTMLNARGETDRLRHAHRTLVRMSTWTAGWAALLLVIAVPSVYSLWTLRVLKLDWPTLSILVARSLVWSFWNASATVLMATDRQRFVAATSFGAGLATAVSASVLVPFLGIAGAAMASLLADLGVTSWLLPRHACRFTGDDLPAFAMATARAFALGVALPVLSIASLWKLLPSEVLRYAFLLPLTCVLGLTSLRHQLAKIRGVESA